jgi:hypothetical protein
LFVVVVVVVVVVIVVGASPAGWSVRCVRAAAIATPFCIMRRSLLPTAATRSAQAERLRGCGRRSPVSERWCVVVVVDHDDGRFRV